MSYSGPLLELKQTTTNTYDVLPLDWISVKSYKPTPNQRLDTSDSVRDLQGHLHRVVLDHKPTKIEFELRPMTNTEVATFNTFMANHYISPKERDFTLRYYNQETDDYVTGHFYMPDPQYNINTIDYGNKVIKYLPTRVAFIEY